MTNRTTEVPRLSWAEVCARRLDRHALSVPLQDARPADIVGTLCGAHGPDPGGAPGHTMFWPQPWQQGHLHQPVPVAARIPACRRTGRPRCRCQALFVCVRTGYTSAVRTVARRTAAVGDGAVRLPLR